MAEDTENKENRKSAVEKLKDHSLRAAGVAYLVGDAALFASGMKAGRYKEATSGLLWGIGGLVCAKYGNPDADKQFELLSGRLGDYLKKQHIEIPQNPDTEILNRKGGVIEHAETFLYAYPSQILNTVYAIGASQLVLSGMQHRKGWDTASGALILGGALAGLLIPEKKPDSEHPAHNMMDRCVEWVEEKPLRLSGALYALNNVTLTMSAIKEMQTNPAQKSYLFKFLTAGTYLFGNAMLAISSKEHAEGCKENNVALEKIADTSARVIAAQAPEVQAALVEHIAAYLSAQPEVCRKAEDISALLYSKLEEVSRERPPAGGNWQARVQENHHQPPLQPL